MIKEGKNASFILYPQGQLTSVLYFLKKKKDLTSVQFPHSFRTTGNVDSFFY